MGILDTIQDPAYFSALSVSNDTLIYYSVSVFKRRMAEKRVAVLFIIQGMAEYSSFYDVPVRTG